MIFKNESKRKYLRKQAEKTWSILKVYNHKSSIDF